MKIVYIAHPVSNDIKGNRIKILKLLSKYHTDKTLPIAPYLVNLEYLNDFNPAERKKGMKANKEYFKKKIINELWVCGDFISKGVEQEIKLAKKYKIKICKK